MNTRDLSRTAVFVALTVAGAFLRIPLWPVPLTLQTFFVLLSGLVLGSRLGALSQAVYILLGLVGLPVFTNGGGLGYLIQPTFGYLMGFVPAAAVTGLIAGPSGDRLSVRRACLASVAGVLAVYLVGVPYLYISLRYVAGKALELGAVTKTGFLVFLPGDAIKVAVLTVAAPRVRRLLKAAGR
jgi:biotin transport system substrate-specific component